MPKIPQSLVALVALRADRRCEYCHAPQLLVGQVFHLDHIKPFSVGGKTDAENLCYACAHCNTAKSDYVTGSDPKTGKTVRLFNPRTDDWDKHFRWSDDFKELIGRTAIGRATIATLRMNDPLLQNARPIWLSTGYF
ncbi:MAG TPA: HNH endonuclease signature motif containing protein, partial [Blastocatellia bacterium]|nr:HNH endonuclease signature motif containing protein [Blastocatellia bacterium]